MKLYIIFLMFAREMALFYLDAGQYRGNLPIIFKVFYRNACRNEKVVVPLHPQTSKGHPCFQGLSLTLASPGAFGALKIAL